MEGHGWRGGGFILGDCLCEGLKELLRKDFLEENGSRLAERNQHPGQRGEYATQTVLTLPVDSILRKREEGEDRVVDEVTQK